MYLPYDYCRCRDDECPKREQCVRWLLRDTGGDWTPFSPSMREGQPEGAKCPHFIDKEKQ